MSRLSRLSTSFALVVSAAALTPGPALARDNDRMPDRWEKRHHLNVKTDDSRRDRDRDGLTNYGEYRAKTNPRKKDSDRDGRRDSREDYDRDRLRNAAEIKTGFDPRDKDSDDDGVRDGRENAGKIVKLSAGSVTIRLAVGGSLTAGLGDSFSLKCAPQPGSGTGSEPKPSDDTPQPGEDAPEPGEDDDPGDLPELPEDEDTGDAPDASATQEDGEDDEPFDDAAFDQEFGEGFDDAAACGSTTLKVGATVHKARVSRSASGPMLVSVALLESRR
jgi:hypothetical protein